MNSRMNCHNGRLESVHAAMICRAVRYFLPSDLDLCEGKVMKVHLEYRKEMYHYFACVLISKFKYLNPRPVDVSIREPVISCIEI